MMSTDYKRWLAENFDKRSCDYNPDNFHGRLVERVIDLARPQAGESVLDVATGSGLAACLRRPIGRRGRHGGRN